MKKLVETLIKQSVEFELGHVNYEFDSNNHVCIFNANSNKPDHFYSASIIAMFVTIPNVSCYIRHNISKQRVEVVVFWQ